MPYKSIQGPLAVSLALIALGVGASGAPKPSQSRNPASPSLRSPVQALASHEAEHLRFEQAQAPGHERQALRLAIENTIAQLRHYEPLAAADLVTHSLDGAASTAGFSTRRWRRASPICRSTSVRGEHRRRRSRSRHGSPGRSHA